MQSETCYHALYGYFLRDSLGLIWRGGGGYGSISQHNETNQEEAVKAGRHSNT